MRLLYRSILFLLLPMALALPACESSLDLDDDSRKEIPLDPSDGAVRFRPDSLSFDLYFKDGWNDRTTLLLPNDGSISMLIDTSTAVPMLWATLTYTLDDTVFHRNGLTTLILRELRLRIDSAHTDRVHELQGAPESGTGTSVHIERSSNGVPIDTLKVIPPSQPSSVQSRATCSLNISPGAAGIRRITGIYTCTITVYDMVSQQTISVPLEGLLTASYH